MSRYSIKIDAKKHELVFDELPPRKNMRGGHDERWWRSIFHRFASTRAAWKGLRDHLDSLPARYGPFIVYQYKEANKLMNKLNGYAIDNVVPMEWREY